MIALQLDEVAELCSGRLDRAPWADEVTGVQIDSRRIEEGDLFVAVGERRGLRPARVRTRRRCDARPRGRRSPRWRRSGAEIRGRSSARVVAITGSTGKTSTKDILAAMCRPHARTVAAEGGHNNEIGLPLTLTRIEPDTEVVVCEMGMRGLGQIAELCAVARPDVGRDHEHRAGAPRAARDDRERGAGEGRGGRGASRRAAPQSCPTSRCSSRTSRATTSRSAASGRETSSRSSGSRRQPGRLLARRRSGSSSSSRSPRGTRRRTRPRRCSRCRRSACRCPRGESRWSFRAGAARSRRCPAAAC